MHFLCFLSISLSFCHPFFCKIMTKGIFQALFLSPAPPSSPHFSSFILSSFHLSYFQTLCPSIVVSLLVSYLTILSLSFFTCQSPRLEVWLIMLLSFSSPLSSRDTLLKTPGLTQQDISASIFSPCLSILRSALPMLSCFVWFYQWSRSIHYFHSFLPFPFFFHIPFLSFYNTYIHINYKHIYIYIYIYIYINNLIIVFIKDAFWSKVTVKTFIM